MKNTDTSPDARLRSEPAPATDLLASFFLSLPTVEQEGIRALASAVAHRLYEWVGRFSEVLGSDAVSAIALGVAAAEPKQALEALFRTAQISVWAFGVDDAIDERLTHLPEVDSLVETCKRIAVGVGPVGRDPLGMALAEIREALFPEAGGSVLKALWQRSVCGLLDGMRFEWQAGAEMARGAPGPGLDAYLEHGLHSVGVPLHTATSWVVAERPASVEEAVALWPAVHQAALAARLTNDLHSFAKERSGAQANARLLGLSVSQIGDRIAEHMKQCVALLGQALPGSEPTCQALHRMVRFITTDLYGIAYCPVSHSPRSPGNVNGSATEKPPTSRKSD
ncbi:MAG: terpene synthase family protein [Pseudonocardiaceae bacterium]